MDGEDKSLDDFFAKKDKGKKGKSKTKGKFTTSSITKQVEDSQKPVNQKSKEQKPVAGQSSNSQKEDEWEDFNEPKEKDYSGLKVQSFQTFDKRDEDVDERAEEDECDGEDVSEKREKISGVWQTSHQTTHQAAPVEEPKEEVKKEAVEKGVYVPPSMRRSMAGQADGKDQSWKYGSGSRRVDPRRPPEISSEIAFPSLQTSSDVSSKSETLSSLSFEPVKRGVRAGNAEQALNRRMNIDLENKYDALSK